MLSRWNWSEKETKDLSFCLQAARRSIDHPPKDETSQWYSFVGPNGVPVRSVALSFVWIPKGGCECRSK